MFHAPGGYDGVGHDLTPDYPLIRMTFVDQTAELVKTMASFGTPKCLWVTEICWNSHIEMHVPGQSGQGFRFIPDRDSDESGQGRGGFDATLDESFTGHLEGGAQWPENDCPCARSEKSCG